MSDASPLVYLALGDSYTIGTGATHESRSFPSLLGLRLERETGRPVRVVNPAVNGYSSVDLLAGEIRFVDELQPDLVTVLIGVNDLVRGRSIDEYRAALGEIYDAVATLGLPPGRAAAISIPDWASTPAAADYGVPAELREATAGFNAAAEAEAGRRGFTWVDITAVSRAGLGSPGWISADDLHPADAQYAAWAEAVWKVVAPSWREAATRP